jgi:hypothetical protein
VTFPRLMLVPSLYPLLPSFLLVTYFCQTLLGIGIAANDVGLISSPSGRRIVIAVFIAGSKAPLEQRESMISTVASTVIQAMQ